jgi:fluoride ion exporter CrcB/FEX
MASTRESGGSRESLHPSLEVKSGRRSYNTMTSSNNEPARSLMSSQIADSETGEETHGGRKRLCTCYRQKASFTEHVVYFCALAVASYVGVVVRIYLSHLSEWNGVPLFPSFSAELVGTAIMGFIAAHAKLLANTHKTIYQAIATGLCGSITTFSSWNSEAAETLLQIGQASPDNATRIIGWVTTLILGVGMPVAALQFGRHLAHISPLSEFKLQQENEQENSSSIQKYCVKLEGITFIVCWILLTCLGIAIPYHFSQLKLMFSIIFAPFGTYLRWHLAPLNSTFTNFKLGTFVVNVGGSWILAGTIVAKAHLSGLVGPQHLGVLALSGLGTGFCGCLTTVSTFARELTSLSLVGTYAYAMASILLAQLGMVTIRGTYEWLGNM